MKTKYKILVALTLLVVFGLGVAAGILFEKYVVHKKDKRVAASRQHAPSPEDWFNELGLSQEQRDQIRQIFERNEERMKAYRSESRARLGELRKMLWDETNAILTPEQKKKNDEMIRRFEERRKQESVRSGADRNNARDRRGDDPPPPPRER
jgi:Spy/CpxP family protein refolding chaperone